MEKKISRSRKLLVLLSLLCIVICAVSVMSFTASADTVKLPGRTFASNDLYKLNKEITPNGSITFEAEIYIPEAYRNSRGVLISSYNGGSYLGGFAFEVGSSAANCEGKIRVFSQTYGNVVINHKVTDYMGTDNDPKFVKLAVTVDTSSKSDNVVLYVNGEKKATATNASVTSTMYNSTQTINSKTQTNNLSIGNDERLSIPFKGTIKNVAMYKGVRTADQISADHAASFYNTTDSNLLFAYDLTTAKDGFMKDLSANANNANNKNWKPTEGTSFTNTTTNQPTVVKPYNEAPLTYEAVVYTPIGTSRGGPIIANYPNMGGDSFMFEVKNNGKPALYIWDDGNWRINYEFNYDTRRNAFVHIAITQETVYNTKTGVNDTLFTCYVNGDEYIGTYTVANYVFKMDMDSFAKTRNYTIGYCGRNGLYNMGYVKNIALHNKPLSASEIKASYENGVNAKADEVIAYYDLTAVKDGFIEDKSGNGYHANYPEWKPTEGRTFTETGEPLYMAKDLNEAPYTYEAVIYAPMNVKRPGVMIGNYPNNNGESFQFEIKDDGKPAIYIYENGKAQINHAFNYDVRRNAFVHVAITHETVGEKSVFKCYVDGEFVDSVTLNYVFKMDLDKIASTGPITIGSCARTSLYWHGNMKNVALHNRPLTAEEIKASYQNGVTANANSLIAYYNTTGAEATSDKVTDLSGNGYDMKHLFYEKDFTTEPYDYSFAVVGDTQFMVYQDAVYGTDYTKYIYNWIVDNYKSKKMQYVFGLGDVIDNGKWPDGTGSAKAEWAYAKDLIVSTLGANNIPYSLIGGNHDYMRPWDTGFNTTFGNEPTLTDNITGYYQNTDLYNYYINFEVEGTPYMLLALEYGANDDVLAWANDIVAANSHRRVIVTTHGYMYRDGTTLDANDWDSPRPNGTTDENILKYNNGDEMWNEFVRKHGNIIMVLSGHDPCNNIIMREDIGDNGNTVQQFLIDPQGMDKTYSYQTGMVAMLYFRNGGKDVSVEYVSTYKTAKNNNKEVVFGKSQFDFTIKEATYQPTDKGEINVWLIGGQSNAVGYANGLTAEQLSDPRYINGFDNVLYYGYGEKWQSSFAPVKLGYGNTSGASGAELGIAAALGNTGEMNAIIKYAQGATALYPVTDSWAAQNFGTWTSPSYIVDKNISTSGNQTGNLYVNFINTVESAITELKRMGYTPVIKGMWWMQGEEETYNGGADSYAELLEYFVSDVRADLTEITGTNMAKMPFVIGKVYTEKRPDLQEGINKVQAEQNAYVAKDPYAAIVNPESCPEYALQDQWHFNAATQSYLGKSFIENANRINGEYIVELLGTNVNILGGGLYKNGEKVTVTFVPKDTYELKSLTMKVGNGGAVSIMDSLDGMSYSFVCNDEKTTFAAAATNACDVETDYGTIPKDEASEVDYPVALFTKDGAYLGVYQSVTAAANKAMENPAGNYVILLRNDLTQSNGVFISNLTGSITLDLGGHTLTKAAPAYLFECFYNSGASGGGKLTVKNGNLVNKEWSAFFCYNYGASLSADISFDFEFENVSFKTETTQVGKNVIFETWEDGVSVTQNKIFANVVFNDCIFDYTGSAEGEIMLGLQARGGIGSVFNVTINGGEIISDRTIGIAELAIKDNVDTIKFGKGAKGYTVCSLAKDVEISNEQFIATNGAKLSYSFGVANGDKYSFTLGEDIITEYGPIPYKYTDANVYPFIIFRNGAFVHASSYFGRDNAESALSYGKSNGTVILMRRDFVYKESQYNNLSQTHTITIDLGGYTFTSTDRVVFSTQKKTEYDTSITVKNGTFVIGSHAVMKLGSWDPDDPADGGKEGWGNYSGGNGFTFVFEDVNVTLTSGATTSTVVCTNFFKTINPTMFCNLTFNNCTFDLSGSANANLTMFDFSDNHCNGKAYLNGGTVKANALTFAKLTGAHAESLFDLGKADGKYTVFSVPTGVTIADLTKTYVTDDGVECVFVKTSENGGYVNYSLYPEVMVGYKIKTSVTLYSNFVYNIYIPEASFNKAMINGTEAVATLVEIDGVNYYHVAVNIPAPESLSDIKLTVVLNSGNTIVDANWTLSVLKYAKSVINGSYDDTTKTLMKDMLVYASAAHTYFDVALDAAKTADVEALLQGYSKALPEGEAKKPTDTTYFKEIAVYVGEVPSFRFYLADGYTAEDFSFNVGKRSVDATLSADGKYLEVTMYAYMMLDDVTYTVKGTDVSGTYNLYSYLDYATNVVKDANLVAIVEGLMKYSASAKAYRSAVTGK